MTLEAALEDVPYGPGGTVPEVARRIGFLPYAELGKKQAEMVTECHGSAFEDWHVSVTDYWWKHHGKEGWICMKVHDVAA